MGDDDQLLDDSVDPLVGGLGLDGDDPLVDDPDLLENDLLTGDEEEI